MKLSVPLLAAAIFTLTSAQAADKSYGISAGVLRSDNIARTSTNEQTETMLTAGLDFSLAEETAKLSAVAAADFSYIDYREQAYESEVVGTLNAQAVFRLLPQRLEWFASDNFGQSRSDPFQAASPVNRENINYFTTGPDLIFNLGSATRGKLAGRYSKVSYEDSPLDSDVIGGTASLLRNLSASTVLSLNVQTEKVEYDAVTFADSGYERQSAFVGYSAALSRNRANLELGYSILSRDNTTRDSKGLLARLDLQRQLTQISTIGLRLGREFSDAGSSFRLQQDMGAMIPDAQSVLPTPDPFTSDYASLSWALNARRTSFGADLGVFKDSYEQQTTFDRRRMVASASVSRNLTPNLRFQLRAVVSKEEFENLIASDYRETTGSATLSWQAGRRLSFSLQYDRAQRSADTVLTEYQENRGWLQIRWGEGSKGAAVPSLSSPSSSTPTNTGG